MVDLAKMVMEELELRQLATTDSLTGAMSRSAFRDATARTVALALRHNHDLSCIVYDLDHFKAINDTLGHSCGDQVLVRTIKTSKNHLRLTDYLGRMGGEAKRRARSESQRENRLAGLGRRDGDEPLGQVLVSLQSEFQCPISPFIRRTPFSYFCSIR